MDSEFYGNITVELGHRRENRSGERAMQRTAAWFALALCAAALFTAVAGAAQSEHVVFLSTQLRPISEAQKMRNFILRDFPGEVDYLTERPGLDPVRISKEGRAGGRGVDVVGALHGELQSIVDALEPLDGVAAMLAGRGIPEALLALGKLGTAHQLYIPWIQASYIMVANKKAVPYLPGGADIGALSYDQFAAWTERIRRETEAPARLSGGTARADAPALRRLPLPVLY